MHKQHGLVPAAPRKPQSSLRAFSSAKSNLKGAWHRKVPVDEVHGKPRSKFNGSVSKSTVSILAMRHEYPPSNLSTSFAGNAAKKNQPAFLAMYHEGKLVKV